mgnify:CR=1 FL=1
MEYYIHDKTRGYVGNSMVWWRKNHHGYTCDITDAHVFSQVDLATYLQADDLVAYPCDVVRQQIEHHITNVPKGFAVVSSSLPTPDTEKG